MQLKGSEEGKSENVVWAFAASAPGDRTQEPGDGNLFFSKLKGRIEVFMAQLIRLMGLLTGPWDSVRRIGLFRKVLETNFQYCQRAAPLLWSEANVSTGPRGLGRQECLPLSS